MAQPLRFVVALGGIAVGIAVTRLYGKGLL